MIKILAIDDDLDFHEILKIKLSQVDFELTITSTEIEFENKFNEQKYDLILLDLSIGDNPLKGLEILSKIRQVRNNDTPVIVLTNTNTKKTVSSALELGANDYVNKPVDGKLLVIKIKQLVGGNQAFAKEIALGTTPGKPTAITLSAKLRLVSISEIGFIVEGNAFIAKGSRVKLKSERIKEIFGTESIDVYSTGFNSEVSGVYLTSFEIDPDLKETINKVRMWIKTNLAKVSV
jgi:DNA-binding response OmpR family regulator